MTPTGENTSRKRQRPGRAGAGWRFGPGAGGLCLDSPGRKIASGTTARLPWKSEATMAITTISDKFEITIPEELRNELALRPGQQIELVRSGDRVELIPVRSIRDARGFLKGIRTTTIEREPDRI
jgi:AbrB family looped-hinge helix DNA binding protein